MSKAKRVRQKNRRQREWAETWGPTCSRCGQRGRHFVPPCLGEPGFYACPPVSVVGGNV